MFPAQCDDESKVAAVLSDDGDERQRLWSYSVKCPVCRTQTHVCETHKHTVIYSSDVRAERERILTLGRTV